MKIVRFLKNNLQVIVIGVVVGALAFGGGFLTHQPQTKIVKIPVAHTVTKTVTHTVTVQPPSYHVGNTQDGITLVGVYPYSYQDMMAGNGSKPPTVHLLFFALSGASDLPGHTAVSTTDGTFLVTDGPFPTIPACGKNPCIPFLSQGTPAAFYYKNLKWYL